MRSSRVSTAPSRARYCGNCPQTPMSDMAYGWVPPWQMAVLASEIVASEASCWIGYLWPDLISGIREKRVPIFDEGAKRIARDSGDIRRRPLGEIDVVAPRYRATRACYRGRGAQHRHEHQETRAFHSALRIEPSSPKLMSANVDSNSQCTSRSGRLNRQNRLPNYQP